MKITAADRAKWNARPTTMIHKWANGWFADRLDLEFTDWPVCSTKSAAINAAIRAERNAKGKK